MFRGVAVNGMVNSINDWFFCHGLEPISNTALFDGILTDSRDRTLPLQDINRLSIGFSGQAAWFFVSQVYLNILPELEKHIRAVMNRTELNFLSDDTFSASTDFDDIRRVSAVKLHQNDSAEALLTCAHEFAHALEFEFSGGKIRTPMDREYFAFVAERAFLIGLSDIDQHIHLIMDEVRYYQQTYYIDDCGLLLATALQNDASPYSYEFNYPIPLLLSNELGDEACLRYLRELGAEGVRWQGIEGVIASSKLVQKKAQPLGVDAKRLADPLGDFSLGAMAWIDACSNSRECERTIAAYVRARSEDGVAVDLYGHPDGSPSGYEIKVCPNSSLERRYKCSMEKFEKDINELYQGFKPDRWFEFLSSLGLLTELLAGSSYHRDFQIGDYLRNNIIPAVHNQSFRVFGEAGTVTGFISWSRVSDSALAEVLSTHRNLRLNEWDSGQNLLIVDIVAQKGTLHRMVRAMKSDGFTNYASIRREPSTGRPRTVNRTGCKNIFRDESLSKIGCSDECHSPGEIAYNH